MKSKNIKRVALGLAATAMLSATSSCKGKESEVPSTTTGIEEEQENIYGDLYVNGSIKRHGKVFEEMYSPVYETNEYKKVSYEQGLATDDLYFIRIDGKTYITTKVVDITEDNIVNKYYALDSGEFIGQTLDINWYSRAVKKTIELVPKGKVVQDLTVPIDENLNDQNYFDGEYGLGKNLPHVAVIKASDIFENSSLSKAQIEALLNNDLFLKSSIEKCQFELADYSIKESYVVTSLKYTCLGVYSRGFGLLYSTQVIIDVNEANEFVIETDSGLKNIIGYKVSTNKADGGSNYIYDIASSKLVDLRLVKVLAEEPVLREWQSISDMRKSLENPIIEYYSLDQLRLIATEDLVGEAQLEKYYIVVRDKKIGSTYKFNAIGENDITISGSITCSQVAVLDAECKISVTEAGKEGLNVTGLKWILEKNGLQGCVKNTYTEDEIVTLLSYLRTQNLKVREERLEEEVKTVKIDELYVIDTTLDEDAVKNTGLKYLIVKPFDNPEGFDDIEYYESWDGGALARFSSELKTLRVDILGETLYSFNKVDDISNYIISFEEMLRKVGLSDMIKDEYSEEELEEIHKELNGIGKVLANTK